MIARLIDSHAEFNPRAWLEELPESPRNAEEENYRCGLHRRSGRHGPIAHALVNIHRCDHLVGPLHEYELAA